MHVIISLDVSSFIHVDDAFKRLAVGDGSDESEYTEHAVLFVCFYGCDLAGLNIFNLHPLQDVVSADFFHNRIPHEVKLRILECFLLDGFCCTKFISSVDDRYFSCELGQIHSLFYCGVSAADYIYFKVLKEVGITGSAVGNTLAHKFCFALASDRSCVSAGSDDHVLCLILGFFGVKALLNVLPFAIVALFAGLMLGAFPAVKDQIKGEKLTLSRGILFAAGLCLPVALSAVSVFASPGPRSLEDLQFWHYIVFLMLGYLIAVTQLVPGLSATALLMMVGYFTPLMNSVSITFWQSNPQVLLVYLCLAAGLVAGLLTVSKLLSSLIARCRAAVFYTVIGLSLGSIITMFFNPEIIEVYRGWTAGASMWTDIGLGICLFIIGTVIAYLFVRYERKHAANSPTDGK